MIKIRELFSIPSLYIKKKEQCTGQQFPDTLMEQTQYFVIPYTGFGKAVHTNLP